jgi:hypothetical protein
LRKKEGRRTYQLVWWDLHFIVHNVHDQLEWQDWFVTEAAA